MFGEPLAEHGRLYMFLCFLPRKKSIITKNWNRLQIRLNQVNILNWWEPHQFSPLSSTTSPTNKYKMTSGKGHNPGSQNLACLVRLYSGGQWTIAEAQLASSLCIRINRRCPFPLVILFPACSGKNYLLGRKLQWELQWPLSLSLWPSRPMILLSREILDYDKLLLSNVAPTICSWIMAQDLHT